LQICFVINNNTKQMKKNDKIKKKTYDEVFYPNGRVMTEKTFPEWEKNINNILKNIDKIGNNEYFKRESIKVEYKNKNK